MSGEFIDHLSRTSEAHDQSLLERAGVVEPEDTGPKHRRRPRWSGAGAWTLLMGAAYSMALIAFTAGRLL